MVAAGVAAVIVAVIYAATGSDDRVYDPDVAASQVRFTAGEHRFEEATVRALAGTVTIELLNEANGAHDLAVMQQGVEISRSIDFDASQAVGKTEWTAPRSSSSLTIELEPGTYQIVCTLPGHVENGMEALLIVEAAS